MFMKSLVCIIFPFLKVFVSFHYQGYMEMLVFPLFSFFGKCCIELIFLPEIYWQKYFTRKVT